MQMHVWQPCFMFDFGEVSSFMFNFRDTSLNCLCFLRISDLLLESPSSSCSGAYTVPVSCSFRNTPTHIHTGSGHVYGYKQDTSTFGKLAPKPLEDGMIPLLPYGRRIWEEELSPFQVLSQVNLKIILKGKMYKWKIQSAK